MKKKIIGVTVGTPTSPKKIEDEIKPIKTVNGNAPDEDGNVKVVGDDGHSIFYCKGEIKGNVSNTKIISISDVDSTGRSVQVGDLLISVNGYLCRITDTSQQLMYEIKILASLKDDPYTLTDEDKQTIVDEVLSNFTDVTEVAR